ncbi:MAG TPA: AMP-binding protein, partial [Sphingobacteriaceae bacterium]
MRQESSKSLLPEPVVFDYDSLVQSFNWDDEAGNLSGLPKHEGLNIAYEAVDRHVGTLGDHVAIRWIRKDRSIKDFTYRDLCAESNRLANVLTKLGVSKGDTVFTLLGRVPELYIAMLGTLKKTAIFCPLFSVFGPEPVHQRLSKGSVKILITTQEQYRKKIQVQTRPLPTLKYILLSDADADLDSTVLSLRALMAKASSAFVIPPTRPEDAALLHFTSGTTGMPKGALHVHWAVLTHFVTGKVVLDFQPDDVYWCTADPGWVTGTSYGIIAPLVHGITNLVDEEEFDGSRWYSILQAHKVNVWYTAPTAIRRLMRMSIRPREQYNLQHLRLILSVGEPLHAESVRWVQETFNVPVLDNWWQTETGGIMISNYRNMTVRPGSMGKPLPGVTAALAEIKEDSFRIIQEADKDGHLVLKRGWPSMFVGYWLEQARYEKCFRGDWYITGDLARRDSDGYFWFIGRADDIIKTSGHLVGPFEIESTLMDHPQIS